MICASFVLVSCSSLIMPKLFVPYGDFPHAPRLQKSVPPWRQSADTAPMPNLTPIDIPGPEAVDFIVPAPIVGQTLRVAWHNTNHWTVGIQKKDSPAGAWTDTHVFSNDVDAVVKVPAGGRIGLYRTFYKI
jgi:anti-sigma factor RsiW